MKPILQTAKLSKKFGGLHVTNNVDFELAEGEVHCLIGPNGAGKSTFFRLLLGEFNPSGGHIFLAGEEITHLKSYERIKRGLSVKFQVPGVFKALSVRQNLVIALQTRYAGPKLESEVERLLAFLRLEPYALSRAGSLSHGQQQWLEIGIAISLRPRVLLLDEPTAGMSPEETHATGELVKSLNQGGVSILAVEHDMEFVRQVAQKVTVLHLGSIFAQGAVADIVADPRVGKIYLGEAAHVA
ncbi:MAG TPA: ABC transporter ATP-binding protein [Chthoniobacterales bacterium]